MTPLPDQIRWYIFRRSDDTLDYAYWHVGTPEPRNAIKYFSSYGEVIAHLNAKPAPNGSPSPVRLPAQSVPLFDSGGD